MEATKRLGGMKAALPARAFSFVPKNKVGDQLRLTNVVVDA